MGKIFIIIVVLAAVFYLYNKVRTWRTPDSLIKRIYETKTTLSLAVFLTAFGANLLSSPRTAIDWIVGIVFVVIGLINGIHGYKAYRHYTPQLEQ